MSENYIEIVDIFGDGNLVKKIFKLGEGECPKNGQEIVAHYTGRLLDGTKFDSSVDRGQSFKFKIGVGQVIKAWDMCFATMKKGEKAKITSVSKYAYGTAGSPPKIPPNATLIFDVELIDFYDKPKEIHEMDDDERYNKALKLKEDANELIKKNKSYKEAYSKYKNALKYINSDISEHKKLLLSIYLNLSLTCYKIKNYNEGIKFANNVLDMDNNNVKALYRKSLLLNITLDYDEAIKTVKILLKLNNNNLNKKLMKDIKNN